VYGAQLAITRTIYWCGPSDIDQSQALARVTKYHEQPLLCQEFAKLRKDPMFNVNVNLPLFWDTADFLPMGSLLVVNQLTVFEPTLIFSSNNGKVAKNNGSKKFMML
jgi:hypothetical protein